MAPDPVNELPKAASKKKKGSMQTDQKTQQASIKHERLPEEIQPTSHKNKKHQSEDTTKRDFGCEAKEQTEHDKQSQIDICPRKTSPEQAECNALPEQKAQKKELMQPNEPISKSNTEP